MAILESNEHKKPVIDLSGSDGNAFVLLATARSIAKKINFSEEQLKEVLDKMMESDYNNLILTFDKYFGEYVDLKLPKNFSIDENKTKEEIGLERMGIKLK